MTRFREYSLLCLAVALVSAATISFSTAGSQPGKVKYDRDGDGLIEIEFLEQLDAIRFDLDGDGKADHDSGAEPYAAAFPTSATEAVCDNNCNGYELARSLDFAAVDSYASGTVNEEWTNGEGWQPIQSGEAWIVAEYPFAATFDGNGHAISNLYINRPTDDPEDYAPAGLFGSTAPDSVIRKLGLIDVHVAGFVTVGGLVGGNLGKIRDSHVTGRVSGAGYVGGLAGYTGYTSQISGSHFSGAVAGRETDGQAVGGLVGYQDGVISASYVSGRVSGDEYVGGLTGENRNYIIASYSSADVTGNAGVGGLAGVNRVQISGSYATGRVTGGTAAGGLAGYNGGVGRIIASYATSAVTGDAGIGGLVGENRSDITASYATGPVSGNENVGGLAGWNTDNASITASYATGRVSGSDNLGGLIGLNAATVTGGVWDTETSGAGDGVGRGDAAGVTGQTTVDLQAATGYAGVYRDWEIYLDQRKYGYPAETPGPHNFWDFGTSGQYPALKAYLGFDGLAGWWETGKQPTAARPPASTPAPVEGVSPDLAGYDSDGDGLIEVSSLEQLDAIRFDLDGDGKADTGSGIESYATAYPVSGAEVVCGNGCQGYELARSLDFNEAASYAAGEVNTEWTANEGWRPIGDKDDYGGRFNAHFDGNGHTIANLHINRASPPEEPPAVGLFGYTGYSAVIGRTGIDNASVAGLENAGVLAGLNMGEISDVHATGSLAASGEVVVYNPGEGHRFVGGNVGGMVGVNWGSIRNSRSDVSIWCTDASNVIGGLAGLNSGEISDSHATGSVSCAGHSDSLGGLTGVNSGTISSSYATGAVMGDGHVGGLTGSIGPGGMVIASYADGNITGGRGVGGLAGGSSGVIRGSFATGEVTGDSNVGGLAGSSGGRIIASYATGEVTGVGFKSGYSGRVSGGAEVGGLVGSNNFGRIIASYATGAVSGESNVGGLAGESHHSRVVASYATGSVSGVVEAGGLIGAESGTLKVSGSYWDSQTSGREHSSAGSGKTTAELQSPTAYTGIFQGWNADLDDADGDDAPATGADDFWDFGKGNEYPALKFDFDGDGTATWQEFGHQERTASRSTAPVAECQTAPVAECQVETVPAGGVVIGAWSGDCLSFNRPGSYARFYVFTLDTNSEVFITLESGDTDTYLYMQKGAGTTGRSFRSQGSPDRYSRIEDGFAAGTYTIEAATYEAGQTGSFTLTVHRPGEKDGCVEMMATAVITGAWRSDCASVRRPGSYARFYTFTLTEGSEVIIDLESSDTGTYLYLLQGSGTAGEVLEDYGSGRRNAQLGHTLGPGTYTVEVTTYSGAETGDFMLTINGLASPPPPPMNTPAPTPSHIPTATLPPAPTPTLVSPSTPTPAGPASTPAPTATPIAAQGPTPAARPGGACNYPDGDMPPGAAAVSMFLLSAPLAMISGLQFRARRRGRD